MTKAYEKQQKALREDAERGFQFGGFEKEEKEEKTPAAKETAAKEEKKSEEPAEPPAPIESEERTPVERAFDIYG